MPKCWDDMEQCELRERWLHMSCKGLKTDPEASGSALSADRQTRDVFVTVKVLFWIPQ